MKKEILSALALAALFAPTLYAQQTDSVRTRNLSEVVVTATKFPKAQGETGKVLTLIDEDQIRRSAGKDLAQVLNEQVGLFVNGANSNPGKDKAVYLQGAGTNYTLILIDGIPLNDPAGFGGAYDLRMLPLDQVERVEILKGSQSTLYGSDAIAGVINVITRKSGNDKPLGVFGNASYGSYNSRKATLGVEGGTGIIDYNVSGTHYATDGISEARDITENQNFDKDGAEQNSWQANIGIKPTDNITLRPFVRYSKFNGQYDAGALQDDTVSHYNGRLLSTGATGQWNLGKASINALYSFDKTEREFFSAYGPSAYNGRFQHGELFGNYTFTSHIQALAGISYQQLEMKDTLASKPNPSLSIVSPYASFFLNDFHGFYLEVGGRYVHHSTYGNTFTYSINPSYRLNNNLRFFANYATGFKAPTLSQLYGQYGANENLKPEESKSLEAGAQWFSASKDFNVRGTFFWRRIDQVILYGAQYTNLDKQNDHGIEIEPEARITSNLTLRGFYAFVTGEVTTNNGVSDTTYNNLIRRPKHSFGIAASYQVTPRLFASVNLKTFGKRSDLYFNPIIFETQPASLDAYQLLDVHVSYTLLDSRLTVFADARNILNQKYDELYGYNTMKFNATAGVIFKL